MSSDAIADAKTATHSSSHLSSSSQSIINPIIVTNKNKKFNFCANVINTINWTNYYWKRVDRIIMYDMWLVCI